MRKILLLPFLIFFYACQVNQEAITPEEFKEEIPKCRISRELTTFPFGSTQLTENSYDSLGRISESKLFDGNGLHKTTKYERTFDSKGRVIKTEITEQLGNAKFAQSFTLEYHPNGRVKMEKHNSDLMSETKTYDESGNLLSRISDSNGQINKYENIYSDGRMIEQHFYKNGVEQERSFLIYVNGLQTGWNKENLINGTKSWEKYTYNELKKMVKKESSNGYGYMYNYNAKGALIEETTLYNQNLIQVKTFHYGDDTRLLKVYISKAGGSPKLNREYSYYPSGSKKTFTEYMEKADGQLFTYTKEIYDEQENRTYYEAYWIDGTLLHKTESTYVCD